ncbi:MAG: CHASE domain-containing protein [Candidatus Thiodiazotropha sp.]
MKKNAGIFQHPATAWGILALSLAATLLVWYSADHFVNRRAHDRFEFQSQKIKAELLERLRHCEMVLHGAGGLFEVDGNIDQEHWRRYVASLEIPRFYSGIRGLGFSRLIQAGELTRHEQAMHDAGLTDYQVRPAGERPFYTVIDHLSPLVPDSRLRLGFDMMSEPASRAAMEHARDSGAIVISDRIDMRVAGGGRGEDGFILFHPVYRHAKSLATVEQRRQALLGYVFAFIHLNELLQGVGDDLKAIGFDIHDGIAPILAEADTHELLHLPAGEHAPTPETLFTAGLNLAVEGRRWSLHVYTLPGYIPRLYALAPQRFSSSGLWRPAKRRP